MADSGFIRRRSWPDDGGVSLAAYRDWQAARARVIEAGVAPGRSGLHRKPVCRMCRPATPTPVEIRDRREIRAQDRRAPLRDAGAQRDARRSRSTADRARLYAGSSIGTRVCSARPDEERAAAPAAVEAALAHPLLARAARGRAVSSRISSGAEARRRPVARRHHRSGVCRKKRMDRSSISKPTPIRRTAARNTSGSSSGTASRWPSSPDMPARAFPFTDLIPGRQWCGAAPGPLAPASRRWSSTADRPANETACGRPRCRNSGSQASLVAPSLPAGASVTSGRRSGMAIRNGGSEPAEMRAGSSSVAEWIPREAMLAPRCSHASTSSEAAPAKPGSCCIPCSPISCPEDATNV